MSELVYTHTIDPATDAVANEVQQNFVDAKSIINGNLEGGPAPAGNIKADGITARELTNLLLVHGLPTNETREGLANNINELKVTPGANRDLNVAAGTAWIRDDSGVLAAGALIPATYAGGTVSVPANSSGQPRADRVIFTMNGYGTGTVSVLPGTGTAGATIDNMTGAAAVPNDAVELSRMLTVNAFAGPYVDHTSVRNVQPWSKPMDLSLSAAATFPDIVVDSAVDALIRISFEYETSAFAQIRMFPNSDTGVAYYQVWHGGAAVSSPAFQATEGMGGGNNNGLYLTQIHGSPGAGGMIYVGEYQFGLRNTSANSRIGRGTYAFQSKTGSGNQVITTSTLAQTFSSAALLHYIKFQVESGTITGNFRLERVPAV